MSGPRELAKEVPGVAAFASSGVRRRRRRKGRVVRLLAVFSSQMLRNHSVTCGDGRQPQHVSQSGCEPWRMWRGRGCCAPPGAQHHQPSLTALLASAPASLPHARPFPQSPSPISHLPSPISHLRRTWGGMRQGTVTDGAAPAETACRSHSAGELASLVVTTISSRASGAPTLQESETKRRGRARVRMPSANTPGGRGWKLG